ncbi:uncharacterized protein (DUF58 family) [Salsuginibacillus halophilus]|uniref:Uncharacterized protein (DUF58 family) n=1 Tax=Salsuginibacillus halophilus TaxID=517424 RepID=A0A2P8HLD0_9BACI|nr:DUF58 domain-containing protein [Salsuginibacillus halophilus]PSL47001.1 uncharacterized protein (DUF58 family) [Salsuginibacillus halophilus]
MWLRLSSYVRWGLRAVIALLILVSLFAYAMFQGGFVSWFLFYTVLIVFSASLVYISYPLRAVTVERTVERPWLMKGGSADVTIHIYKRWLLPLPFLIIEDAIPENMEIVEGSRRHMTFLTFRRRASYTYRVQSLKRGEAKFQHVRLQTTDMFGIWQKEHFKPVETEMIVYPKIYELTGELAWTREENETPVSSPEAAERTMSVASVRDYEPGDRMTSIDWKVTARSNKLVTKEFDVQEGQRYSILVQPRGREPEAVEATAAAAASLVHKLSTQRSNFTLFPLSDLAEHVMPSGRAPLLHAALRELARLDQELTSSPLPAGKSWAAGAWVYCTPLLDEKIMQDLQQLLKTKQPVVLLYASGREALAREDQSQLEAFRRQGGQVCLPEWKAPVAGP